MRRSKIAVTTHELNPPPPQSDSYGSFANEFTTEGDSEILLDNAKSKVTGIRRALALARLARRRKVRRQSGHSPRGSPSRPVDRTNIEQEHPEAFNHGAAEYIFCGPRAHKMKNLGGVHASGQPGVKGESGSLANRNWPSTPRTPDAVSVIIADTDASSKGPVRFVGTCISTLSFLQMNSKCNHFSLAHTGKHKALVFAESVSPDSSTKKAKAVTHVVFNKNSQNITGPDSLIGAQCAKCRVRF